MKTEIKIVVTEKAAWILRDALFTASLAASLIAILWICHSIF